MIFPLPNLDILVDTTANHEMFDTTANHEMFSFMDSFSRYNQIKMNTKDAEMTMTIFTT